VYFEVDLSSLTDQKYVQWSMCGGEHKMEIGQEKLYSFIEKGNREILKRCGSWLE
jgi:hypothetical protein